jgi:hypothetical protein
LDGDTTGTLDNDNANSLDLIIHLIAGTTYTGGTFSTSWSSATDNTRVSSSNVNIGDSTDNNFEITGIQLEVSEQATPFEHRSFGEELALCERYYFVLNDGGTDSGELIGNQYSYSSTHSEGVVRWGEMRASPSLVHPTGSNYYSISSSGDTTDFNNMLTYKFTKRSGLLYKTGLSITQGRSYRFSINNASAYLHLDAEL